MHTPRISCIMPTMPSRRAFVPQAIKLFNSQDYPNRELIIIDGDDEGFDGVGHLVPAQSNIEYIKVDLSGSEGHPLTLGAKRNLGISLAQGTIICLWDDDDYFRSDRLTRQLAPILAHEADVTGIELDGIVCLNDWTGWKPTPVLRREIFHGGMVAGTLLFRRALWGISACYPNTFIGEDTKFLWHLHQQGARIATIPNDGLFVYIRHGANTWPLPPHYHPHLHEWRRERVEDVLPEEAQGYYRTMYASVAK